MKNRRNLYILIFLKRIVREKYQSEDQGKIITRSKNVTLIIKRDGAFELHE